MGTENIKKTKKGWIAWCSKCGWETDPQPTRDEARAVKREHVCKETEGFLSQVESKHGQTAKGKGLAVVEGARNSDILGNIVFYTVGDILIPVGVVRDYFERNDMNRFRPAFPKSINTFQLACASLKHKDEYEFQDEKYRAEWKSEMLAEKKSKSVTTYAVYRTIFLVKGDGTKESDLKKLEHHNIANIEFAGEDHITVVPPQDQKKSDIQAYSKIRDMLEEQVRTEFDRLKDMVNAKRLRDCLMRSVRKLDGVPMTGGIGGAWFVPVEHSETLEKLADFIDAVKKDGYAIGDVDMRFIPVADTSRLRRYVEEDARKEAEAVYQSLLEKTFALMQGFEDKDISSEQGKMIKKKLDDMHRKVVETGRLVGKYDQLLGVNIQAKVKSSESNDFNIKDTAIKGRFDALIKELTA